MNPFNLTFKSLGKSALLIEWPARIDEAILFDLISLQSKIEAELNDLIVETINAYNSLTIIFKPDFTSLGDLENKIKIIYQSEAQKTEQSKITWKIPVCYDEEFGIDLKEIAALKNCSTDEIISAHSLPTYLVYFTGFLPGFLYLGGLPETLHAPRKQTPRLHVTKGAVAIGGQQTGIYPSASPGGWNIIGNSPLVFFDPKQDPPCFAKAGDYLKFTNISRHQHKEIKEAVENGTFKIECETK